MLSVPSPNYGSRKGHRIAAMVIHVSEGSMASMDSWFKNKTSEVSAHYGISKEGDVHQYVPESHAAWHAGRVKNPTSRLVLERPGLNPNLWTIGIEHEGDGKHDFTESQYRTSAQLVGLVARRHNLEIDTDTVIPHRAIYSGKTCPGPMNLTKLIQMARGQEEAIQIPAIGSQVWSDYLDSNLTLVHWAGPTEWYYTVNRNPLRYGILKAVVAWSEMDPPRKEE